MSTASILNGHDANIFYAGFISGLKGQKPTIELRTLRAYRELVLFREAENLGKEARAGK